jgi:multidrug efflux pump subunit AcrA (membrane-fusion protein)
MPCVPQQAVFELATGGKAVWVVGSDMKVSQRTVSVGEMQDGFVPVEKGLSVGEKIVIAGVSNLSEGMQVALVSPTQNDDLDPNYVPPIKE